jgi:hypothetical protein
LQAFDTSVPFLPQLEELASVCEFRLKPPNLTFFVSLDLVAKLDPLFSLKKLPILIKQLLVQPGVQCLELYRLLL